MSVLNLLRNSRLIHNSKLHYSIVTNLTSVLINTLFSETESNRAVFPDFADFISLTVVSWTKDW